MLNWTFVKYLRDKKHGPSPIQESAQALLSSTIADGDVMTDWFYLLEIWQYEDVPEWLKCLALLSCISGTLAWLALATDGWIMNCCNGNMLYDWIHGTINRIEDNILKPLKESTKRRPVFTSGSLLILGILLEDIPQLIATFLIEDKIRSDHPKGKISDAAIVSLNFALFDILHKLAQSYDLRSDVLNPGYSVIRTIRDQNIWGKTKVVVADINQVLSTSSLSKTAKLWETTTGKCINEMKCHSDIYDAVVMENSKAIFACDDKCLRLFNMTTGHLENELRLSYRPRFVSLSPNGKSIFIGGFHGSIQRWDDLNSEKCSFSYDWKATSLAFLDSKTFVSIFCYEIHLGNIHQEQPIHTIERKSRTDSVLVMSPTAFLIGDANGSVHQFIYSEFEWMQWKLNAVFDASNSEIRSLTKVNESLFVASDEHKAKLYSIKNPPSPLFVFKGHTSLIHSSAFLSKQKAIATRDGRGFIKIWSLDRYLENDSEDKPQSREDNDSKHDEDSNSDVDEIPLNRWSVKSYYLENDSQFKLQSSEDKDDFDEHPNIDVANIPESSKTNDAHSN